MAERLARVYTAAGVNRVRVEQNLADQVFRVPHIARPELLLFLPLNYLPEDIE